MIFHTKEAIPLTQSIVGTNRIKRLSHFLTFAKLCSHTTTELLIFFSGTDSLLSSRRTLHEKEQKNSAFCLCLVWFFRSGELQGIYG